MAGDHEEHQNLELAFADWLGLESALAFTSGYAANVGALSCLAQPTDLIISDQFNHASLIDGMRLSRARTKVVDHGNMAQIDVALRERAERRAWVVVESYYSMDADGPDLMYLRGLCDAHEASLYVDEAHALGVMGPDGRGRCAAAGVVADVLVGTLGKAFGSQGAFVAGQSVLRDWLWNNARSFIYSTGLAPSSASAAIRSLCHVQKHPELAVRLAALAERLRTGLVQVGARTQPRSAWGLELADTQPLVLGFGHIVPVVLGEAARAIAFSRHLREHGLHVQAIRPPTVPEGLSRLRMTVSALHQEGDIDRLVDGFASALRADLTRGTST